VERVVPLATTIVRIRHVPAATGRMASMERVLKDSLVDLTVHLMGIATKLLTANSASTACVLLDACNSVPIQANVLLRAANVSPEFAKFGLVDETVHPAKTAPGRVGRASTELASHSVAAHVSQVAIAMDNHALTALMAHANLQGNADHGVPRTINAINQPIAIYVSLVDVLLDAALPAMKITIVANQAAENA